MNERESTTVDTNGDGDGFVCKQWSLPCWSCDTDDNQWFALRKVGMPLAVMPEFEFVQEITE